MTISKDDNIQIEKCLLPHSRSFSFIYLLKWQFSHFHGIKSHEEFRSLKHKIYPLFTRIKQVFSKCIFKFKSCEIKINEYINNNIWTIFVISCRLSMSVLCIDECCISGLYIGNCTLCKRTIQHFHSHYLHDNDILFTQCSAQTERWISQISMFIFKDLLKLCLVY